LSGLSRRFRIEDAFRFADYTDDELISIMQIRASGMGLFVSKEVAASVVLKVISKQRNKPNFGNVGAVNNLLDRGKERVMKRKTKSSSSVKKQNGCWVLLEEDLRDVRKGNSDLVSSALFKELDDMLGLDEVKNSIRSLAQLAIANIESEEAGEKVMDICLHRIFLGNPGTGKTTVAKLYGRLLAELGYLSNGEVVVVGASKLTGDVVGATATKVNEMIDSCAGKVLVIDEAYVLANSQYGREALDVLVERIQGVPGEDIAVILCGYDNVMRKMLKDCNPGLSGLSRRFRIEDAFRFADYTDDELISIMQIRASGMGLFISKEVAASVVLKVISKQRNKPNFGNVGAVNNLLDRGKERA
jgi:Holliday junction resolvasome RuvABC ATP-dependent DNA helicase subunit